MAINTELSAPMVERALRRVRSKTGVSLAFGGPVAGTGDVLLRHFDGPTLGVLPGVSLRYDTGLGGRAVALQRPIAVSDYFRSGRITHEYDHIIRSEGLRSLVAAPVVVGRQTIGVMYAAFRNDDIVGDRIATSLLEEVRSLEHELVTFSALRAQERAQTEVDIDRLLGQMRQVHAELRSLSSAVEDSQLRDALRAIADRLSSQDQSAEHLGRLTQRESDVLALIAAGMTNTRIADGLGLTLFTVKGYVKIIMSKLQASTRYEAVEVARRSGLIP